MLVIAQLEWVFDRGSHDNTRRPNHTYRIVLEDIGPRPPYVSIEQLIKTATGESAWMPHGGYGQSVPGHMLLHFALGKVTSQAMDFSSIIGLSASQWQTGNLPAGWKVDGGNLHIDLGTCDESEP